VDLEVCPVLIAVIVVVQLNLLVALSFIILLIYFNIIKQVCISPMLSFYLLMMIVVMVSSLSEDIIKKDLYKTLGIYHNQNERILLTITLLLLLDNF